MEQDNLDLNQEELSQVKALLNSRGWEIYLDLSARWRKQKSKELATLIRQCSPENSLKATLCQGEIDGSLYMVGGERNILDEYKQTLSPEKENPTY